MIMPFYLPYIQKSVFPDMDCTAKHGDVAYCLKSLDKQNIAMWHYSEKFHASKKNKAELQIIHFLS